MATSEKITISEIEKHFHLSQGCLDRPCTAEHARHIAIKLKSWERLAPHLGLDDQHIEAIKRNNDTEEGRREAALTKWKEVFSFKATYRKIIEALLVIEKADLASEVCIMVAPQQTEKNLFPVDPLPYPSPQKSLYIEPISPQSSNEISTGSPPSLQLTFHSSQPIAKSQVVKELESKFSAVVQNIIELYTQGNVSLQKLKRIVNNLTPDIKGELGPFFRKERAEISKAKSIDDLFVVLSDFWDYLQPDLLVYLVEQCENNEAKMVVSKYEEELAKCRKQILLQEYIGKRLCNLDNDDRYQIAIRLGNEWHEKTLDDLERMRYAFADEFSLLRLVPKLHGLKLGSIIAIFSLPKSVILTHDQLLKFFQSYNPLQVMVDGVSISDIESQVFHTLVTKTQVTDWEETVQGRKIRRAVGSRDILIIVSSESLQGPDIVPRRDVELTKEDIEKLQRLSLPPEQWKDEASIVQASVKMDETGSLTVVGVEENTSENGLTREYVLKKIEILMTSTRKQGVTIQYFGPGKKKTGDWCFEDGYITFRDLAHLYCKLFKGHVLTIATDCSFSGSWVKELMKFLDEQGVRPCGHSAREKEILIKVYSSCKPTEIPHRLLYSVRAIYNDKNTRRSLIRGSGFEVSKNQHIYYRDQTLLRCKALSFDEPCTFSPEYTWERREASHRVKILRGTNRGRHTWHYVLLPDDETSLKKFEEALITDAADYGQVLMSGWGKDPPNEVKDYFKKIYLGH